MEALSPDVVEFVAAHIRSLNDLQVLIHCMDAPDRWWDAAAVARETGLGEGSARHALDNLARGNLLDIRITGDVRYSFSPGTEDLRESARRLASAFRSSPVAVVKLVADSGPRSVRDFADAFRIRRDDHR